MPPLVLVVDDEASVRQALTDVLETAGYAVATAADGAEGMEKMAALNPAAVLMDIRMPGLDGIKVLETVREKGQRLPIILITAYGNTETTIKAMKLGAFDYITKPFKLDELLAIVQKAVNTQALVSKMSTEEHGNGQDLTNEIMIGQSPAMQSVYKSIGRIVDSNVTVLIRGESGTGKELVARAIHLNSPRKDRPFIKINCASIPETLLESELLGYEKGAFTGAGTRKPGKFELADRGTIFLDEIGEMSPATQAKLLRVLQEKEFERVGGTETIKVDVRIVAATNKNLEQSIQEGAFREDLFFRLNVVEIWVPPLRERKEDIPHLTEFFVKNSAREFHKKVSGFSPRAMKLLMQYNWPGNIRELRNVCERAVLMSTGPLITIEELPLGIQAQREDINLRTERADMSFKEIIADVEKQVILNVLKEHNWNRSAAAQALKMSRSSLYAKMRELGIIS
ncbi:sigma-54-dependent transcriptional regulator [Desulfotomaculum copahuensis]|uniref:DNA-binding transcriptional regulator NtrC n=1 Tax=Desulfotomaculum copahuensis TaxID=1838280 RepID=A0A1B7LD13_9FIRM|nr:sigma-54 dependent transcriptional regulator [Desulfotomaculum copahuensis]OAT80818.1 two-component system response regulator [Desulfotomaculum copahuensis]